MYYFSCDKMPRLQSTYKRQNLSEACDFGGSIVARAMWWQEQEAKQSHLSQKPKQGAQNL